MRGGAFKLEEISLHVLHTSVNTMWSFHTSKVSVAMILRFPVFHLCERASLTLKRKTPACRVVSRKMAQSERGFRDPRQLGMEPVNLEYIVPKKYKQQLEVF